MKKLTIGTHNGIFHSDEIIASALLVSFMGEASFIRSRDPKVLASADILVDVGGKHDGIKFFDHHQLREGDANYGLSSAGMVYESIDCFSNTLTQPQVNLISAVDARDTRVNWDKDGKFEPLFNAVNDCNNIDIGSKAQDEMFETLVSTLIEYFNNSINYNELFNKVSALGAKNKTEKDAIMADRFSKVSKVGMVGAIPMYQNENLEYVDTQMFGDKPFIFVSFDEVLNNYSISTNTNFCKIVDVSNKVFVHANGFFAKTTTLDGLEIKIEEL